MTPFFVECIGAQQRLDPPLAVVVLDFEGARVFAWRQHRSRDLALATASQRRDNLGTDGQQLEEPAGA